MAQTLPTMAQTSPAMALTPEVHFSFGSPISNASPSIFDGFFSISSSSSSQNSPIDSLEVMAFIPQSISIPVESFHSSGDGNSVIIDSSGIIRVGDVEISREATFLEWRGSEFLVEKEGDPTPLNFLLPQLSTSNWMLDKVKEIQGAVGLSYESFEEHLLVLLTAIETSHNQSSKSVTKKQRKLKRLT